MRQALESCLNQTYKNIEIVVVDNASTDKSLEIVESYGDPRIKIFRHSTNLGISASTNTGYKNATGDYLTRFAADDIYESNAVEIVAEHFSRYPNVDVMYSNDYLLYEASGEIVKRPAGPNEKILEYCCVGLCVFFKKKVYERVGELNRRMLLVEDYEYWLRCFLAGCRMMHIDQYLYYFRQHETSISGRFNKTGEVQEMVLAVERKLLIPHFFKYRSALFSGHLRGASFFLSIGQRQSGRKALLWAALFDPSCFLKRKYLKVFISIFLGEKMLAIILFLKQRMLWRNPASKAHR